MDCRSARSAIIRSVFVAALVGSMCGCGHKPVPVEGVVTLDGQPVAEAHVSFILDGGNGPSHEGDTDDAGVFVIDVLPGQYKVVVFKRDVGPHPMKSVLPQSYMHPTTTPFKCTIPQTDRLNLRLTSSSNR
jgi:hypothetical protein